MTQSVAADGCYTLTGYEAAGVIQFFGNITTLYWDVVDPEIFSVINIGLTNTPYAPTSEQQSLSACDKITPPTPFLTDPPKLQNITTPTGNNFGDVGTTLTTVFDGGTLSNDKTETTTKDFSITDKGGTIDAAGYVLTFSGVISDDTSGTPGSLTIKSSSPGGNVILTGVNTYTGATTIDAGGKLSLSGSGSIADSSGVAVNGTFDISGTTSGASIKELSGAGTVELGGKTLTLTNSINANPADYFTGVIQGTGGLTVAGGSETLTGTNTYTGATSVLSGATLALSGTGSIAASSGVAVAGTFDISGTTSGASIKELSGAGTVSLGGKTLTLTNSINANPSDYFTGVIQGTGGLTLVGSSETLTGTNTYTGATSVLSGATLALSGTGSIAASSGVAVAGTFDISGTTSGASIKELSGAGTVELGEKTLTLTNSINANPADYFTGVIQGTGGLTVAGGSETLTGANTYSGTTTIASGASLSIGSGGTTGSIGAGAIVNRGSLTLNRSNDYTFANAMSGGGDLTITGGGTATITSPSGSLGDISITGDTTAYFNTGSLNNSSHAEIVALDANLAPLQLFSGSSLNVAAGSTLRGAGFVNAPTTIAGTLRPGNSPGTIVFGGSVTQAANSVLALDIDGPGVNAGAGNYSSVIVNGPGNTYTMNGAVQPILRGITPLENANNNYSPEIGSVFTVISATGGMLGSFTSLVQPASGLLPNTQFDAIYNANTFQLVITPTNLGGVDGLTPNEKAVGNALQGIRPAPGARMTEAQAAVFTKLYKLPQSGIGPAYDRIGFAIYGDALMSQSDAAGLMASTVGDQMAQRRGSSGGNGNSQKYCLEEEKQAKDQKDCRQLIVWGAAIGQFGRTFATLGDPGYKTSNQGLMFGAEIEVDNYVRVGAFGGYASGLANSPGTASKADLATYSAGVYASADNQKMFVNALAAYVGGDQSVKRNPLDVPVSARPTVTGSAFSLEMGTRFAFEGVAFEPYAGLKATNMNRGVTTETGATPLAATIAGDSVTTSLATAGARAILRGTLDGGAPVSIIARAAYGREFGDQGTNVSGVFKGLDAAATVASSARGRDAFLGGVTAALTPWQGADVFARYDAEIRTNAKSHSFSAGLRISW